MVIELWEPSHKLQMMIFPVIRYSKYLIISFQFETRTIQVMFSDSSTPSLPSGKLLQKTMEIHHFLWENQLFLWSFSIAMLVYQRVVIDTVIHASQTWPHGTQKRFIHRSSSSK
jgi:hypothetical protein